MSILTGASELKEYVAYYMMTTFFTLIKTAAIEGGKKLKLGENF